MGYAIPSSLSTDEPILMIDQPIGFDKEEPMSPYVDGAEFARELLDLDTQGFKCIKIYINSPGGNVVEGWNICNAISKTKTPVDTYNIGLCASMAAVIFMTGRKRIMADYASMMVHAPFGSDDNKMLAAMREGCISILSSKCNITKDEVAKLVDRETWLYPAECLEKGFCTEIEYTSVANQKRMPKATALMAVWKESKLIQANIFKTDYMANEVTSKVVGTSLVAAFLDLNVDSTEQAVLTEVKSRINTLIIAKGKVDDELAAMKKSLDKSKADYEEMSDKYNKMCKEKKDVEDKAKKDAEDAAAKAKTDAEDKVKAEATALLAPHILSGRIKSESKEKYIAMAVATSVADVKDLIEALPLSKAAAASAATASAAAATGAGAGSTVDPNEVPANAMNYMARIQANTIAKAKSNV